MGRKPLGGIGEKTVMVPMRWPPALLARVDQAKGEQDRSAFIREAVERELERRLTPSPPISE
jgi:metal-responsive CopG/Arc/MetJ family transcriptional regulator